MTEPPATPPTPHTPPDYDEVYRRARLLHIIRRNHQREASRRLATSMGTMRQQAIDLSAVDQARRGRG